MKYTGCTPPVAVHTYFLHYTYYIILLHEVYRLYSSCNSLHCTTLLYEVYRVFSSCKSPHYTISYLLLYDVFWLYSSYNIVHYTAPKISVILLINIFYMSPLVNNLDKGGEYIWVKRTSMDECRKVSLLLQL